MTPDKIQLVTKAIVLCGGFGTRMRPTTAIMSKQVIPIDGIPMVFYVIEKLLQAGIKNIMIIHNPEHGAAFSLLLSEYGKKYGIKFTFMVQNEPEGLPQAFTIAEDFIGNDPVALVLGDNIFEYNFEHALKHYTGGGLIFATKVPDPHRFGVVVFDEYNQPLQIIEKPEQFISPYAITGFYVFDNEVVKIARGLKKSSRKEYEIVDVHNDYLGKRKLKVEIISGRWIDAGTRESLREAHYMIDDLRREGRPFFKVLDF